MTEAEVERRSRVPWRGLLLAVGLGFLVVAGLGLVADVGELGAALERFGFWALAAALALAFSNYLMRFLKWQYYLGLLRIKVGLGHSFCIFIAGFLMSVTPAKVGEVLRSVLLAESHGIPVERTAPIVIADRLSDLLALVLLMAAGAATFSQGWPILIAALGLCLMVVLAVQIPSFGNWLIAIAKKLPVIRRGGDRLAGAYESLRVVGSAKVLVLPILLSVVGWFFECLAFYVIIRGFPSGSADLFTATFVYSLATVAGAVAMLPGGLGLTEASMAGLLVALPSGLSTAEAAAATVLIRLATLWFAVILGLAALPIHRVLTRRMRP
jgi:uncharacterized protein (TIRG00374 family)